MTKEREFAIGYNNTSLSSEACAICGGEAGRRVGGSNIPLEVMVVEGEEAGMICPDCQREHAPELAAALEAYYTQSQKTEQRSDNMVTNEQRQALNREIGKLKAEQSIDIDFIRRVRRIIMELADLYFDGGFTEEQWMNYLASMKQRHLDYFHDSDPLTMIEMESHENAFAVYHAVVFLMENYSPEGSIDGAGALLKRILRMEGELPEPVL